jgi:hypothetical protein
MSKSSGLTSIDGDPPHGHGWQVDEFGNGKTVGQIGGSEMAPHSHDIVDRKMLASGNPSHIHKLASGKPGQFED